MRARELLARFRPNGEPVGFVDQLREDALGAALKPDSARAIAEASARTWGLIRSYDRVEITERRPGGRVDHTFVRAPRASAGAGRYRVRPVVGGDRLVELTHFCACPRRSRAATRKPRSANNAIAFGAFVAIVLTVGCIVAVFPLPAAAGCGGRSRRRPDSPWRIARARRHQRVAARVDALRHRGGAFSPSVLSTPLGFLADGCLSR
jgi:hypothetical protein